MKQLFSVSKEDIEINGYKLPVTIKVFTEWDDTFNIDDIYFDSQTDDKLKFERKLERGDIMPAIITVTASLDEFIGSDNMGSVIVENPNDVDATVKEYQMIDRSKADLVANMSAQYATLKLIFERK